jgi:DNA (cytosine-5)-methyltransferase 1
MLKNNEKETIVNIGSKMKAVSLFSGAGGMDVGIMQADFEVLACVEVDPHCCETLRAAAIREKRKTLILEDDIRTVAPENLMQYLGLRKGELDLLCGGPPCQAFSQIGKRRALDDERGMLLFEMVRFAKVFRPKAILIEQVKGLLTAQTPDGKVGGVLEKLLDDLQGLDYVPKWKVILAADYGVPQLRQRVFIVATEKPNGFEFPPPTHGHGKQTVSLFPLPPYRTVGDALEGLSEPLPIKSYQPEDSHLDVTPKGDRRRINGVPEGSHLAKELHLPIEQRCNLTKKDTTKFKRLSRFEPSNTLRCGEIFFHPLENRYLTPREYMRIHGYPDDYLLKGPIRGRSGRVRSLDQHRQVANSVPPPLAYVLAKSIRRTLECQNSLKSSATQSPISLKKQRVTA